MSIILPLIFPASLLSISLAKNGLGGTVLVLPLNSSVVNPTVTNIGSYSGSTATLTLSAAQSLEAGETLTFDGAGRTITISGNIEIK